MRKYYYDYDESEAYEKGRHDSEYGRKDYDYDRYGGRVVDEAYFRGMEDQERETRQRLEEERQREEEELIQRRRRREEEDAEDEYIRSQERDIEEERRFDDGTAVEEAEV